LEIDAPSRIEQAVAHLRAGKLVAFPTETVYGLGADATDDHAVAAIFAAKGRPSFNPLIVHVASRESAERLVQFNAAAQRLADLFWPGPLSLILPRRADCRISLLCSAGLDTLAVRVPRQPLAQTLIAKFGRPIAAPSANRSGRVSPTDASHVQDELGDAVAMILDGGPCRIGLESTVIDLTCDPARILRPGGLAREALEALVTLAPLDAAPETETESGYASPGMMRSHYAPSRPLRAGVLSPNPNEAFLAFGPPPPGVRAPDAQLSPSGDLVEAAANLFAMLRLLDRAPFSGIAVMPVPATGLGAAVNDRLRRAAAH
jgi:L-threonylcarbamoyladenylate synthase